jgi:hypothetical protein
MIMLMMVAGYTTLYCQNDTIIAKRALQRERAKVSLQRELDQFGLTEERITKLNEIGVDLRNGKAESPEMIASAYTDAVVVVKIVAILDWPGPVEQLFHSKERACIQEVLKGKAIVGDTIELLGMSGPITGSTKGDHISVSTDGGVGLGEEAIIFLRRMNKDTYLTRGHKRNFELGNFQSDSTRFYGGVNSIVLIQNGKVSFRGQSIDVSQFKSNIKKVAAILEK